MYDYVSLTSEQRVLISDILYTARRLERLHSGSFTTETAMKDARANAEELHQLALQLLCAFPAKETKDEVAERRLRKAQR